MYSLRLCCGVLLCKIAKLILITVPQIGFPGDERIMSQDGVCWGGVCLKHMRGNSLHQQPGHYSKYAQTLGGNCVATLRTRIKVYPPSPTQEALHTQTEIYLSSL